MTKKQAYTAFVLGAVLAVSAATPASAAEHETRGGHPGLRKAIMQNEVKRQGPAIRKASSTLEGKRASSTEARRAPEGNPGGVFDFGRDGGPITTGKVTAVNGTSFTMETITVRRSTSTKAVATSTVTYTVDASNAPVLKNKATTTVASIVVGDAVVVKGKPTGTAIVAKAVIDAGVQGMPTRPGLMKGEKEGRGSTTASTTHRFEKEMEHFKAKEVKREGVFNRVTNFFGGWFK